MDASEPRPEDAEQSADPRDGIAEMASTLSAEHELLIREVTARAAAVLNEADAGRWPTDPLHEFVNYLQLEVLRQIVDEEWWLFRAVRMAPEGLTRLRSQHLELRMSIDLLTQCEAGQRMPPARLAATTRHLLDQIRDHVVTEERVLAAAHADAPAMASLGSQPHEWYDLTEGSVIDLDRLPGAKGADAVLSRLLRLHPGERVELQSGVDPGPLWQRVIRSDPGGYQIAPLERGPRRWRVELVRRSDT